MKNAVFVKDFFVSYGSKPIINNISFTIKSGLIAAIVGPNGAGKSTLIKAMLQIIQPNNGSVLFFDAPLNQVRSKIAYIPQRAEIDWDFPITVYDVVLMGRYQYVHWYNSLSENDHALTKNAIHIVGLEQYINTPISKLSGGQQQLCFIARALCMQPDLYILDEPFTGVDEPTEKKIISLLQKLRNDGKTIMIVHHDLYTVSTYFEWIICLNQTIILQGYTQEILSDPDWIKKTYKR